MLGMFREGFRQLRLPLPCWKTSQVAQLGFFALLSVFDSMFAAVIQVAFAEKSGCDVLEEKVFLDFGR